MARFTYRNHNGLTGGFLNQIQGDLVEYLVEYSAKNVPWNELAQAPEGWKLVRIDGETAYQHPGTGIVFKSGFRMIQRQGQQKWEGYARRNGFRLDLQGIENGWANWAVQTGGVTVAACLMQVSKDFGQGQLAHGLTESARQTMLCELTM